MKSKFLLFVSSGLWFVLLLLPFSGCAIETASNVEKFPRHIVSSLIKPKESTKADVESLLGKAWHVTFTDREKEIWTYYYTISKSAEQAYRERRLRKRPPGAMFIWEAMDEDTCDKLGYVEYHILTISYDQNDLVEKIVQTTSKKDAPVSYGL